MTKILVGNNGIDYTFDASAKTVTITGLTSDLRLDQVLLITNITDNELIYSFADPDLGGSVSSNVITLNFDTTPMSDTDELQIDLVYNNDQDYTL